MNLGKLVRLNRLFAHPSGRLCSVAADHFINYTTEGSLPAGLVDMKSTIAQVAAGKPDAFTLHRGMAKGFFPPFAGKIPLILQSTLGRVDDTRHGQIVEPDEALRLGADAFAICGFVRGPSEAMYLTAVAKAVQAAAPYDMPVIMHVYPRSFAKEGPSISFAPEDIAWAARCAGEMGVDIIKVPYCNEVAAYRQIVANAPAPVVAAGGPKTETFGAFLSMLAEVVQSGARGATIGRNVWGFDRVTQRVQAACLVIHEGKTAAQALAETGLLEPARQ